MQLYKNSGLRENMSEIKFTDSQRAAINAEAPKILISAAAGSGKSTVLTERIISSVTSEEKAFDISKILAVTFTKASAEDLKAKIGKEVRKAVLRDPENKRLKAQLIKLSSAKISTIHGLCFSLIKSHFQMLGLNASMRVADEVEAAAIRSEVLTELLESAYAGYFKPIPDFAYFTENFITERDDSLNKILFGVYDKIKNIPNGFAEWERRIDNLTDEKSFGESDLGRLIIFHLSLFVDYACLLCKNTVETLSADGNYADKYLPAFEYDLQFLSKLKRLTEKGSYREIAAHLSDYTPVKLKSVKADLKTDEGEYARTVVKPYVKDTVKEFDEKFFSVPSEQLKKSGEETAKIARSLILFLKEFDVRFTEEKLRRSVLDFNDLEHYALKLLYNDDGKVSDTARRISESLDEIYVDEYQDVNPLQNKIFEALSISCPIFMVGDIKQSIYSFRGAAPSIFSDYRRRFSEHAAGTDRYEKDVTVFLSDNFRSAHNVTEFVNAVSEPLFSTPFTEEYYSYRIPYSKEDRLICNVKTDAPAVSILIAEDKKQPSADEGASENRASNFNAPSNTADAAKSGINESAAQQNGSAYAGASGENGALKSDGTDDISSGNNSSLQSGSAEVGSDPNNTGRNGGACYLEAEMVANKISELISGGAAPSEIAVLLRGTKTDAPIFEAALKRRNIPISTDKGSSLFDAPEVQLSLCLLNCIDNPYRDIFLAGALRSPVFGFTLDDLIRIKRYKPDAPSLFDALREFTAAERLNKGVYFLEFLSRMRSFASENSIDRTLWHLYTETAFFTLIYDGGKAIGSIPEARRANLLKLHGIAKAFSASDGSSLYSFIEYLRAMISGDKPPSAASIQGDGVKIMSIHHSKGLEFTHCFVCRTSRAFSNETSKSSVIVNEKFGLAMRIKDALRLTSADTVFRQALIMQSELTETEEEMRLLYVALSRAKTALYITGYAKDFSVLERSAYYSSRVPHPMLFSSQNSYLKWILTALKCKTDLAPRYSLNILSADDIYGDAEKRVLSRVALNKETAATECDENVYNVLKERFDYVYPYEKTAFIPSKLSVSRLYPEILDALETEALFGGYENELFVPDFDTFVGGAEFGSSGEFTDFSGSSKLTDSVSFENSMDFGNSTELNDNTDFGGGSALPSESVFYDNKHAEGIKDENESFSLSPDVPDNSPKMKTPSFLLNDTSVSAAEKGTATHVFMQFCDFNNVEKNGIDAEISRLTEKRFILSSHAEIIDKGAINAFFSSDLYKQMKSAVTISREYRFNIKLPASDFTKNPILKEQVKDDFVFVQGVIDCYFRDENGRLYLLDYKTDRVPREIRGNEEKEARFFAERHSSQLSYYKKALERLTGQEVYQIYIYSFDLGKAISLKL